ncbi:mediator of DNA damage checkpoint protein 1 isoform X2 [Mustelus asterias]
MDQTQLLSWEAEEELRDSDRQARGRLRVFAGNQGAETGFLVYAGENVIGRHESCHIRIPAQSVSKKHAVIEIDGDVHLIHDCNSLNKTRRRNAVLKPQVRYAINDGDLFLFADVACQYVLLPPVPAEDGDSGSDTGSESMFPQSRLGIGAVRPDSTGGAGDDLDSKATGSGLESPEDSLVLSPTQPYQTKSVMSFQSDTYVKESEDDDTPWRGTGSFASRDGCQQTASVHQTPSAHVVPESDDEEAESSRPDARSMQLHYDSDTDLEDNPQPCEKWAEPRSEHPANGNCATSETGPTEEQHGDNTGDANTNHSKAAQGTVSPGSSDTGRAPSRVSGDSPPAVAAAADHLPHFSWDSDSEVGPEEQEPGIKSSGPAAPAKMDPSLAQGADTRGTDVVSPTRSLIHPEEQDKSSKADDCADSHAASEREAKEMEDSVNERELQEGNSDTDIDDGNESYALQPTQCFVSDSQDERAAEADYIPDGKSAAAGNTEEEATQLFIVQSPTFDKDTCKTNATVASNTEEEATQLFTFQSPTFGKDPSISQGAAVSNTEEEATQPITLQSPTFGRETFKSNGAAASEMYTARASTPRPVPQQQDCSEPGEDQPSEANQEEQWTDQETQPFCLGSWADEPECVGESGAEDTAVISPAADRPVPTSQDQPHSPPKASRSLPGNLPKGESGMDSPAVTEQPETPQIGDGGCSWQVREGINPSDASEQQTAEDSEEEVNGETSGGTVGSQETRDSASVGVGDVSGPKTEERSQGVGGTASPPDTEEPNQDVGGTASPPDTKEPNQYVGGTASPDTQERSQGVGGTASPDTKVLDPAPALMSDRRPSVTETEDAAVPRDKSQPRKARSVGAGGARGRQHRKAPEPSAEVTHASAANPRRGRGRPKSISVSTTDEEPGRGEEERESPPALRIGGRRAKQRSMAAPKGQAESAEDTSITNGSSEQQPAGRGRGRRRSVAAPAGQTESAEDLSKTGGSSERHPVGRGRGRGRGRRRSVAAPAGQTESAEDLSKTGGSSEQHPVGRGRGQGRRRSVAAPAGQTESAGAAPEIDGPSEQRPVGRGRGRRRTVAAPAEQTESAGKVPQTDGSSPQCPAGRGRGRGRRKSVAAPARQDESVEEAHSDGASSQRPAGRGRRRLVAAPAGQDGSVEEVHSDTASSQRPAGRGRRKQERSQETGLAPGRKRRVRVASLSESEKESSSPPPVKTRRTACRLSMRSPPGSPPKIMFTGLVDENGMKVIEQLGGEVVESVHDSTHLVTDRIRRTVKFLCAVARGIPVVTPEWLKKCGKSSCFLSTGGFLVDDSDQEQKFNFKLAESLRKAKEQPLLQGFQVHVTSGVLPEPSQMESIIQCSGANILPKMPRVYKEKTLVISCLDDLPKCKAARDAGIPIVNAEFLLTGILQQTVDLVSYRLDGVTDGKPEGKGKKRSSTTAAAQPATGRKKKR